jgi:hypothetical protein
LVSDAHREQVLSYLHAQAGKLSTEQLLVKRQVEVDNLLATVAGLSSDEASWAPEGEWSAVRILQHVLEGVQEYRGYIAGAATGRSAADRPAPLPEATVPALSAALRREHGKTQKLLLSLDASPATRTVDGVFGPLNWREWALFERVHYLDHVNQVRALKDQLDTPGR